MNESLEKRVSMLERLLREERARTKNVTTIKFTENDSSSTAAGVYAFALKYATKAMLLPYQATSKFFTTSL